MSNTFFQEEENYSEGAFPPAPPPASGLMGSIKKIFKWVVEGKSLRSHELGYYRQ